MNYSFETESGCISYTVKNSTFNAGDIMTVTQSYYKTFVVEGIKMAFGYDLENPNGLIIFELTTGGRVTSAKNTKGTKSLIEREKELLRVFERGLSFSTRDGKTLPMIVDIYRESRIIEFKLWELNNILGWESWGL